MNQAPNLELIERAKVLISERRYQDAVRACRRALLSVPADVEIRLLLGEALLALARYDEVRLEMLALTRRVPDRADGHRLLGEAHLRAGRSADAIVALNTALRLVPGDDLAEELLREASAEKPVEQATIERWFSEEARPTTETGSPEWEDELTVAPRGPLDSTTDPSIALPQIIREPPAEDKSRLRRAPPPPAKHKLKFPSAGLPPLPGLATSAARPSAIRADDDHRSIDSVSDDADLTIVEAGASLLAELESDDTGTFDDDMPTIAFTGRPEMQGTQELMALAAKKKPLTQRHHPSFYESTGTEPTKRAKAANIIAPPTATPAPLGQAPARAAPPARPQRAALDPSAAPPPEPEAVVLESFPQEEPLPEEAPLAPTHVAGATVEPPQKRSRGRTIITVIVAVNLLMLLCVAVFFGAQSWIESSNLEDLQTASRAAGASGDRAAIESLIEDISSSEEPSVRALRARLLATLTFEHDLDRGEQAEALLHAIDAGEPQTDAAIAVALLALDRGEPSAALQVLSGLRAEGEQIAEAFRARAYATAALGRWAQAEEAARSAVAAHPRATRHLLLHALMRHRSGDTAGGLTLIDGVSDAVSNASVRAIRARILQDDPTQGDRAREEAQIVIDQMADRATPHELAWAHLIVAHHAANQGDDARAVEEATAAAAHPPPVDEAFGLLLVETMLRAGAATQASEQVANWPEPPLNANERSLLRAEVALAVDELDVASRALESVESGPRADLARARVFELRGQPDQARPLYESVIRSEGAYRHAARIRLGAIVLASGAAEQAVEILEAARREEAENLDVVPVLARAYLALDRVDAASELIEAALARRAGASEILAMRGAVQLRRGQIVQALASLREAARGRPADADLQSDLGDAARRAGEREEASTAYDRALVIDATHAAATLGRAHLALSAGDLAAAEREVALAAERGSEAAEVALVRGGIFVHRGDGALGAAQIRPLANRHRQPALYLLLAELLLQAESDRSAGRAFRQALRGNSSDPNALLGQAELAIREGELPNARSSIERAESAAEAAGRAAELSPRVGVARGRLAFENGNFASAISIANRVIEADATYAPAHLLLANVAIEQNRNAEESLRRGAQGRRPPAEAVARLAITLRSGDEACTLARRYMRIAPNGYDAGDVRDVIRDCP